MDDRAICLPWDKKFVLTSLGQAVVYGGNYKGIQRYPSVSIPLGQTLKNHPWGRRGVRLLNGIAQS